MVEFSPGTASPMGLAWDFHEKCRSSLEQDFLRLFFSHAVTVARQAAPEAAAGQDGGVCAACLSLLNALLCWEFRYVPLNGVHRGGTALVRRAVKGREGHRWMAGRRGTWVCVCACICMWWWGG